MIKKSITLLLVALSLFGVAQAPSGYYDLASGKTGYELKTSLSQIISKNHQDKGYSALWACYKTSDIDNYYEKNGSILDMYSENPNGTDSYEYVWQVGQCTSVNGPEGTCYNREHSLPKSYFGGQDAVPMANDAQFIFPSDYEVNSQRSNFPYGKVGTASWTSKNGSKLGTSVSDGYTGTVFEPIDEFKGDIARMQLYFITRYESQLPSFYSINPDSSLFDGSNNRGFKKWYIDLMLAWHNQDPVSQKEIDRNNAVYAFQNNRNPYIDHPEYVNQIWNSGVTDTEIPSTPVITSVSNITNTSATVTWSASTDNVGVSGYRIYRDGNLVGNTSATNFNLTGLVANTTYQITVEAYDTSGNNSTKSDAYAITTTNIVTPPVSGSELYISEYYEGLSNNKMIEITNPTSTAIDLSAYSIKKQSNGAGSWINEKTLSGSLPAGSTLVLKNSLTALSCTFTATSVAGAPMDFNGNDPIGLFKSGNLIDIVGNFNGGSANFAIDTNLRRKVAAPNNTFSASQWQSITITSTEQSCDNIGIANPTGNLSTVENSKNSIRIYPNPVRNNRIYFSGNNLNTIEKVEIYAVNGALVQSFIYPFKENNVLILNNIPKGMYLVKYQDITHKVIVE